MWLFLLKFRASVGTFWGPKGLLGDMYVVGSWPYFLSPQAQKAAAQQHHHHAAVAATPPGQQTTAVVPTAAGGGLYPSLEDYMGLNLAGYTAVSSNQLQHMLSHAKLAQCHTGLKLMMIRLHLANWRQPWTKVVPLFGIRGFNVVLYVFYLFAVYKNKTV